MLTLRIESPNPPLSMSTLAYSLDPPANTRQCSLSHCSACSSYLDVPSNARQCSYTPSLPPISPSSLSPSCSDCASCSSCTCNSPYLVEYYIPAPHESHYVDAIYELYRYEYEHGNWLHPKPREAVVTMLMKCVKVMVCVFAHDSSLHPTVSTNTANMPPVPSSVNVGNAPNTIAVAGVTNTATTLTGASPIPLSPSCSSRSCCSGSSCSSCSMHCRGALVGFGFISGNLNDPLLEDMIVHAYHRKRGLGLQIIYKLLAHPELQYAARIDLYTHVKLIPFYSQLDFKVVRQGENERCLLRKMLK